MIKNAAKIQKGRYVIGGDTDNKSEASLGWWERIVYDKDMTDTEITISKRYSLRPDLFCAHFYGNDSLGWLILQINSIVDVNEEFVEGKKITVPSPERVNFGLTL